MYASISSSDQGLDGAREVLALDRLGGSGRLVIALWDDPPASEQVYLVERDHRGSCGQPAAVAAVLTFAGPISPAHKAAAVYAGEHRIAPAMATAPGLVRVLELWDDDRRRQLVIVVSASLEDLEAGGQRIATLELLPGEDEALLPGPDAMEIYRVHQPTTVGAR